MEKIITQKDLHDLLDYNQETGIFMWRKKRRGIKVNVPLGTCNGFGYLRITVLGKSFYAHRLAWLYVHGKWPASEIDHINGDKKDNRIANLRDVSPQANQQNKIKAQKNSDSKILGVSWHKKAKKWQAHICVYKQRKYLGLFENIEDAAKAYQSEKQRIDYECS